MIGRDLDFDLHNAIQDLIGEGLLEENASAHSVARLVIHDGYDSLTPTQQALYDAVVTPATSRVVNGRSRSGRCRSPAIAREPLCGRWPH